MTSPDRPAEPAKPLLRRLTFRFAAALCAGAAAILVAAGLLNVALQREQMTGLVRASAERGADVVLRSTRAAMLANAPEEVQRILDDVGAQRGIDRIRIFDKQGTIRKSTRADEVGRLVDKRAEQCFVCHSEDRPIERLEGVDRARFFRDVAGHEVLGVIVPIRNEPDCASGACHAHDPGTALLGVLDLQFSLDTVHDALARSETQMAWGLAATVAAVLAMSGGLAWWLVLRPVRRLRAATERVAAGDLSARTEVDSPDELGDMGRAWNEMVAELERSRDELRDWNERLEDRVAAATADLESAHRRMLGVEKMASLGKLAAVVAHEINNPLAGIATYAKLLRRKAERRAAEGGPAADDETLRALDLVETEARRCGTIVRNLLSFSRTQPSTFADEDLRPVLDRCAALVRHQADIQQVALETVAAADAPRCECDAAQVQQAVLALVMNALDATPAGGRVAIRLRRDHCDGRDGAAVEVADTGTGIAHEHLQHIFEPFYTTKEGGKGVGLGLAVVYGIVQRHHGRIDVETRPGEGTTFTVRLPLRQPPEPPPAAPAGPALPPVGGNP